MALLRDQLARSEEAERRLQESEKRLYERQLVLDDNLEKAQERATQAEAAANAAAVQLGAHQHKATRAEEKAGP